MVVPCETAEKKQTAHEPVTGRTTSPELGDRLYEAFQGDMTPKFLATQDESGVPNVVPIISIQPYDRSTLIFGNFLMWKTERNLKKNPLVSVTVFTKELFGATLRGVFRGFEKTGEYVDIVNSSPHMRYNAYMGVRNAGSIEIVDISRPFQWTKLEILSGNLCSRLRKGWGRKFTQARNVLHPLVAEKFARIAAVKVISYIDDQGSPCAVPVVALQPAAPDVLLFPKRPMTDYLGGLREGAEVAASVITLEPVAFQVKGTFRNVNDRWGAVVVDRAYHASPPFVGKLINPGS